MGYIDTIQLEYGSKKPLYIQIYEKIAQLINEKKLKPGEKLPPIRRLASILDVNNITVVNAYRLLEEKGYCISKVGSGTYVRQGYTTPEEERSKQEENLSVGLISMEEVGSQRIPFDFFTATISPEYFPVEDFKNAINLILDRDRGYTFAYGESQGYLPLRQSLKDYLSQEYRIEVSEEYIYIVSGAQQGIDIVAKAFLDYGDTVFVESPTYPGAIEAFRSRGAKIVEIPILSDGIDIEELSTRLRFKPPKLFYTMPNFQNPTGVSYSEKKKKELIGLSERYGFMIIEDDHMNDLYYVERPQTLKALDPKACIFYIKSFSKLLMPGLRLGLIVVPKEYSHRIAEVKYFSDITSSGLIQRAMDVMLRDGSFYTHAKRMREDFREKWRIAIEALKKYLPSEIVWFEPKGGVFFWINLPDGYYSMNLYSKALNKGILIAPGDFFYPDQRSSRGFRLSIAQVDPAKIEEGIKSLSDTISELLKESHFDPLKGNKYKTLL